MVLMARADAANAAAEAVARSGAVCTFGSVVRMHRSEMWVEREGAGRAVGNGEHLADGIVPLALRTMGDNTSSLRRR